MSHDKLSFNINFKSEFEGANIGDFWPVFGLTLYFHRESVTLLELHKSQIHFSSICEAFLLIHKAASVKNFFVRCVGILSKYSIINDFSRLCTDVLTVSFSNLEDVENVDNHCYSAQRRQIIKTDTNIYNVTESDLFVTFTDSEDDTDVIHNNEIDKFLHDIEKNSKKEDSGTRPIRIIVLISEFVFLN